MTEPDKALSLVGPILAAHQEVVSTAKKSLEAAIKCGDLLIKAQEAVGKGGKWSEWLAKHCSEIKDRTARQYMQLADPENAAALDEAKRHHGEFARRERGWRNQRQRSRRPKPKLPENRLKPSKMKLGD